MPPYDRAVQVRVISTPRQGSAAILCIISIAVAGCARPSTGTPASSFTPVDGVQADCAGVEADICDRIIRAALRASPVAKTATRIAVTPVHDPQPFSCPSSCPSFGPEVFSGAVLSFANRSPLDVNCVTFIQSEADAASAMKYPMFCGPVDEAEQHSVNIHHSSIKNESGIELNFWTLSGTGGGGGATGGCGLDRVGVPFSFYVTGRGEHGESIGEWHEVFRSEEIGNPEGDVNLNITITGPDEVKAEVLDHKPGCNF